MAAAVAAKVSSRECRRGVIVDGAGIGSSMTANKFRGVRAALCYDLSSARNSREHNDANVLTLGAGLIGKALAEQILNVWLDTDCTEPRHLRRVAMIEEVAGDRGASERSAPSWGGAGNFGLAGAQAAPHNAEPPAALRSAVSPQGGGNKDVLPGAAAFQARAAQWLMTDQPVTDNLEKLSGQDLDRVVTRIAELLASGQPRGNQWCFDDVCIDARLARVWIDAGVSRLSGSLGNGAVVKDIASYIDHTLLKPDATQLQVEALCAEAAEHRFASVCVNPVWVKLSATKLRASPVLVCTVVGFPLGANLPEMKAMEARRAIRDGAKEIDMVINVGALKSGDDALVFRDIRAVVDACEDGRALCKVIIETALLTDEEKVRACVAARKARADFVKTSTGFASGGATAADVALMSRVVADARMGVKASGGVKNLADLDKMVAAGATRIGASAGLKIMKEAGG